MPYRAGKRSGARAGAGLGLAIAACFSLLPAEAHAINRYTSTSMACSKVKATISREGAAIMRYTSPRTGVLRYDRYVANRSFCQPGETIEWTSIPTADQKNCRVNRCKEIEFFDLR